MNALASPYLLDLWYPRGVEFEEALEMSGPKVV